MDKTYLFFDVECANCFGNDGKICTFGYALTDADFNVVKKDDILINPDTKWDWYVKKNMIKYKAAEFSKKPKFDGFYAEIKGLLEGSTVFGFDVGRDIQFVYDDCVRYKLAPPEFCGYDIQKMFMQSAGRKQKDNLTKIAEEYGIDCTNLAAHSSRDDAELSMLILKHFCNTQNLKIDDAVALYAETAIDIKTTAEVKSAREMKKRAARAKKTGAGE